MGSDPGEIYEDDLSVPDDEFLYRLIRGSNTKFEGGTATGPQSNAFQDAPSTRLVELGAPAVAVSIYLQSEMSRTGMTPGGLVARWDHSYGVASLTAGDARAAGQGIVRWPKPSEPEHGMIFCRSGPRKTQGQSKQLARSSILVIAPPAL